MMETYKNLSGDSGVTHYKTGEDYIDIKFKDASFIYSYTHSKTGKYHVDIMKILAKKGKGLSAYITQNTSVRENYIKR